MIKHMWMMKTAHLAPFYGIAFTRKDLKRDLTWRGITDLRKLTFVRVTVEEQRACAGSTTSTS